MAILKFPNEKLFVECKKVTVFGPELKVLLDAMWETMKNNNGLGLAANQVGLEYRMFVMEGPNEEKVFLVNPYITNKSKGFANLKEGCLSAPGEFIIIPDRAEWVQVTFENEKGEPQVRVFKGIHAVCVQHEIEHLEGKTYLLSQALPKSKRRDLAKKWGLEFE